MFGDRQTGRRFLIMVDDKWPHPMNPPLLLTARWRR
jgi:hypothetical protein